MNGGIPSETHSFSMGPQKVVLHGLEMFLSHCQKCGRDFVRTGGTHHWYAAHIGVFSIDVLLPKISERWLSEPCPMERSASDEAERQPPKNFAGKRQEL